MPRYSANLGFLWSALPLPQAIRAAKAAGFDAVECHWPYETPAEEVKAALHETGLKMLGLNTRRGDVAAGDSGLAALPGREAEARAAISEAITYAAAIGCGAVHVMAGKAPVTEASEATFRANLAYAAELAAPHGLTILIEPLNRHDASGYFLSNADQALAIIAAVGAPNLKLMFDCYHIQIQQGDVLRRLEAALPHVGHIQIAAVPDRGEPDRGELDYRWLLPRIDALGWSTPIGAEYRPRGGSVEEGLGWREL
ncbi:hydroxypyruvate isomerase family protein [Pannonibacter indicus]|uniref:hydroxypyruvate isomerase family protein n=1 Tax=Pannonibacter indicus TaxID=466044 RepID=UPI0035AE8973